MCVYLRAKFEVSSIILTNFRQGGRGNFSPLPPKNEPLKSPLRLRLNVNVVILITLADTTQKGLLNNHSLVVIFIR